MSLRQGSAVEPRDVVIVGGGVAGVEALMALADLGDGRLRLQLVANHASFVLPPQLLGVPWGEPTLHLDLAELCRAFGARFVLGTIVEADLGAHEIYTSEGATLGYDRLLLAPGAPRELVYGVTRTLGFGELPEALAADLSGSVAVVAPAGASWTLPAYQLALSAAGRGRDVRVLTAERDVLEAFGPACGTAVRGLLERHGVVVETGRAPRAGAEVAGLADTVVALPLHHGPAVAGTPNDAHGFLRVDARMAVEGVEHAYAAGDAVDGRLKQGGLAAQQADTAASEIVTSCGGHVPRIAYEPVLRGKLTTPGGEHLYLRRSLDGRDEGRTSPHPLWQPHGAICAWRLARWLEFHRGELELQAPARPGPHARAAAAPAA